MKKGRERERLPPLIPPLATFIFYLSRFLRGPVCHTICTQTAAVSKSLQRIENVRRFSLENGGDRVTLDDLHNTCMQKRRLASSHEELRTWIQLHPASCFNSLCWFLSASKRGRVIFSNYYLLEQSQNIWNNHGLPAIVKVQLISRWERLADRFGQNNKKVYKERKIGCDLPPWHLLLFRSAIAED